MLAIAARRFPSSRIIRATHDVSLTLIKVQTVKTWIHTSSLQASSMKAYGTKFKAVVTEGHSSTHGKTPIVAILGWNSSKDKHLAKYSSIFEEKGFCTLRIPANPLNTFFRAGTEVKRISHHILDVLLELNSQQRPVFLYAFSNGGCAVFFHIMEALSTPDQPYFKAVTLAGTIFDSCPVDPNIKSVKIVQESVTDSIKVPILKPLVWHSLGIIVPLVVHYDSTVKRFMSALTNSQLRCPQLIFYSKSDRFASYKDIDKYARTRKHLGVQVMTRCWEKSGHVNHYREHEEEYLKYLNTFVDECLIPFVR